jgi:hypothetical protein
MDCCNIIFRRLILAVFLTTWSDMGWLAQGTDQFFSCIVPSFCGLEVPRDLVGRHSTVIPRQLPCDNVGLTERYPQGLGLASPSHVLSPTKHLQSFSPPTWKTIVIISGYFYMVYGHQYVPVVAI